MASIPTARATVALAVLSRPNGTVGAHGAGFTHIAQSGPVLAFPPWR
ncbi:MULTISPECIES: hypothetical protein [unclassified Streptomyces]|nr:MULTISPECIES: hypothetical protein [unclassified Streptomyces]